VPYVTSFELVGELPSLADSAHAYVLAKRTISRADVERLARTFDMDGEIVQDQYGAWTMTDGSKTLWLYDGPGGSWSYYDQEAGERSYGKVTCAGDVTTDSGTATDATGVAPPDQPASSGEGTSEAPAGDVGDDQPCDVSEPTPAANLPSQAEAERRLRDLLDSAGIDVRGSVAETYDDPYSVSVSLDITIEGEKVMGYGAYATFGDNGALIGASGYLETPQRSDDYPLIGTQQGFERLDDRLMGFGGAVDLLKGGEESLAADSGASSGSAGIAVGEPAPDQSTTSEPAPDQPVTPEQRVVQISGVRLGYTPWYGADGNLYILPAYVFVDTEGGEWTVPAVADEYLGYDESVTPTPVDATTREVVPADGTVTIDSVPAVEPQG
jgi:hypothetical protein